MASRVQCWRTKTTWSGRPGERNAFRPHFVVHPHRLLQSNLRAARIVIGRPCRIDGTQPSNCAAWAKIHNNLYSDEPRSAASRLSRPCLPRPRETVPQHGQRPKFRDERTVITVMLASQNALSTTNPDGTRLVRRSACCMALIPPMGTPHESETASNLSQSQIWKPIDNRRAHRRWAQTRGSDLAHQQ